jgi:hypothetical protein
VEYVDCDRHTKSDAHADAGPDCNANANATEKPAGYPAQQNATDDTHRQCGFAPTRDFLAWSSIDL